MAITNITEQNFEVEVLESTKPVLLDFWATWCGPCMMLAPIVDEIAEETDAIKVCKVNVDEQPKLAQMFGIASIPTLMVVKGGEIVNQAIGYRQKEEILDLFK